MSRGTITTLDFVISVLREHEKDLTELSDKLEEIITSASGQNMKKDVDQIQSILNELEQKVLSLDQKIESRTSSIEDLLKQLMGQVLIQNQNLNLLIEVMKNNRQRET